MKKLIEDKRFDKFIKDLYSHHKTFDFFYSDYQKSINFCLNSQNIENHLISIEDKNEIFAQIVLIINKQFDENIAFFGFFECVNNEKIFFDIWNKLVEKAKELNIRKLQGPINGSIWFQYRCRISIIDEEIFPSEPLIKEYYTDFFRKLKNIREIEYHSAYRKKFSTIISLTEKSYNNALDNNFEIIVKNNLQIHEIKTIFEISKTIFSTNWAYSNISWEEFLTLYNSEKIEKYISSIYLLKKYNEIIGFCTNLSYNKTLIMKTIAVLPEYQTLGLGNAIVHKVHYDAEKDKIDKIIYALVRKTNKVKYFPTDDIKVFREYIGFEIEI